MSVDDDRLGLIIFLYILILGVYKGDGKEWTEW
jgi:hypothetical protein